MKPRVDKKDYANYLCIYSCSFHLLSTNPYTNTHAHSLAFTHLLMYTRVPAWTHTYLWITDILNLESTGSHVVFSNLEPLLIFVDWSIGWFSAPCFGFKSKSPTLWQHGEISPWSWWDSLLSWARLLQPSVTPVWAILLPTHSLLAIFFLTDYRCRLTTSQGFLFYLT